MRRHHPEPPGNNLGKFGSCVKRTPDERTLFEYNCRLTKDAVLAHVIVGQAEIDIDLATRRYGSRPMKPG
jgi:hypothetical protein